MLRYLLRRTAIGAVTLVLITFVIYALLRSLPGDVLSQEVGTYTWRADQYQAMRRELGLDRPWPVGYVRWLAGICRGDLGKSNHLDRSPVAQIIAPRILPTLLLCGTSLFLAWLLAVPLGIWCGARSGTLGERAVSAALYVLYSFPSFVAALYLLIVFSVQLDWLPLSGMHRADAEFAALSPAGKALDVLAHMVLPVACFTYGSLAYLVRFVRANLQEVLRQDYIRTARAKGLSETAVVVKHAFRNSLIPLVTLLGLSLPALLGGSVILERIFLWLGMGNLLFSEIGDRDFPVIMAITLLYAVLVLAGNLLADILYAVVDPRVRTA